MSSFVLVFLSVCCLFVCINSAAVESVVTELQKDTAANSTTEKELSTNQDCIQPKETGRCFALFYRFAYDVEKRECVEFIYGGCAGNSNNFETKADCEVSCVENKTSSTDEYNDVLQTTVTASYELDTTTEQAASEQS